MYELMCDECNDILVLVLAMCGVTAGRLRSGKVPSGTAMSLCLSGTSAMRGEGLLGQDPFISSTAMSSAVFPSFLRICRLAPLFARNVTR